MARPFRQACGRKRAVIARPEQIPAAETGLGGILRAQREDADGKVSPEAVGSGSQSERESERRAW